MSQLQLVRMAVRKFQLAEDESSIGISDTLSALTDREFFLFQAGSVLRKPCVQKVKQIHVFYLP